MAFHNTQGTALAAVPPSPARRGRKTTRSTAGGADELAEVAKRLKLVDD